MTSPPSFGERMIGSRIKSPIRSVHTSPKRSPSEYQLDELDPRPDGTYSYRDEASSEQRHSSIEEQLQDEPWDSWSNKSPSSSRSPTNTRIRPMFNGPPPPISSSVMVTGRANDHGTLSESSRPQSLLSAGASRIGDMWSDKPRTRNQSSQDSVWRGLRRREKALEQEIQQLLDLQATGLVAGSTPLSGSEADGYSDTGSSTPTGTFYSTATSKSRMMNSLHVPTKSTRDGNVIPVRQPKSNRSLGLRSARTGLKKTMSALGELKREEDAHVDAALLERKRALIHLGKVNRRRVSVQAELQSFEKDNEEPLGKELRSLGSRYEELTVEIRSLEEKLVAMRNQRRSVRDRIDDVKSRREAGLSGYRGALKDADSELTSIMRHPPVQPIDEEMLLGSGAHGLHEDARSGRDFLRLLPERRTAEMAKSWWDTEISALEQRRGQIAKEQQALDEGGETWNQVISLVDKFESSLRQLMKGSAVAASVKGKEKVSSQQELIRNQLPQMDEVVAKLEQHLETAEEKGWNLLICAIGAELEAFREAQNMLKTLSGSVDEATSKPDTSEPQDEAQDENEVQHDKHKHEDSDNEVPADLLVSKLEEDSQNMDTQAEHKVPLELSSKESSNEVPPEFLAEHE